VPQIFRQARVDIGFNLCCSHVSIENYSASFEVKKTQISGLKSFSAEGFFGSCFRESSVSRLCWYYSRLVELLVPSKASLFALVRTRVLS